MEFHRTMYELHQRVNSAEQIIGWHVFFFLGTSDVLRYATGDHITDNSVLIHDFYGREASSPVHLLLDTGLSKGSLSARAFISSSMTLGDKSWGSQFQQIKMEFTTVEAEKTGCMLTMHVYVDSSLYV